MMIQIHFASTERPTLLYPTVTLTLDQGWPKFFFFLVRAKYRKINKGLGHTQTHR